MLSDAENISLPWIYHVVGKLDHNNSFLPTGYQLRFPPDQIIAKLKHRITALMNGKPQHQTDHCPVMISHTLLLVIQYYNGSQNCRKDITRYLCPLRLQFYMMTSTNGNIFRITGPSYGEFTGDWWIPPTKPSDADLWCFFWICTLQTLNKQSRRRWFETPSRSLWRHCNWSPEMTVVLECCNDFEHMLNIYASVN